MIKIDLKCLKPYRTIKSNDSFKINNIPNNIGAIHRAIDRYVPFFVDRNATRGKNFSSIHGDYSYNVFSSDKFVYLYHIEKRNTKKVWTGRKRKGDKDQKVKSYKTVRESHVVMTFYRVPLIIVKRAVQHARHFELEVVV